MSYNVEQIYNLVNDAVKDALGKNYGATKVDSTDFVSMGKSIDNYQLYEGFYGALVNRIAKTVYFVRSYSAKSRGVLRDEHEYGAFIQKVYYKMPDAVANATWNIPNSGNYQQASPYDVEGSVVASGLIYGNKATWSIEVLRPIEQIKSAFLDPASMMAFIDGIYIEIENAFNLEMERLEALADNTAIASALDGGKARNLLAEYNEKFVDTLTPAKALTDADFLRFAAMEINQLIDHMGNMSTVFNKNGYETFTSKDNLVVEMLSRFAAASDVYLKADTFHKDLVALPGYRPISYWQSSGPAFALEDISTINIENDQLDNDISQTGIICFVKDVEAAACYFGSRRSWEVVNPRSEVVVHGEKAEKGYAVDNNANAVVFYMGGSGTLTLSGPASHGSASASSTVIYRGADIAITVTPDSGYVVDKVLLSDGVTELRKANDGLYHFIPANDENETITVTVKSE